ncbi:MAG: outer membrane lipid asymmetry maintenance protein MlaD [Nitrospirae bacterium]|uniref:outer membrane lipid asymmetry maintenance protein MlaD n=1 Tax=Candidatus Magnetobacterium casense TaxID=1455061 RepID=UPI00058E7637|nr:outer membrane lipid asymmetry maintenance protein MlaD [Candidatus Magnetobacterium casensis]MBF0337932.1 outer membrane lipid asymmetry maintenance protein MlaD [Nitrospirota bacterium]
MKRFDIEIAVGVFLVLGFLSLAYLSVSMGNLNILSEKGYVVIAEFNKTGGLKKGAPIEIAGVEIGKVKDVSLNKDTYQARVTMFIKPAVKIQEDAIASIKTKGLLGERYLQISPGGSPTLLSDGGKLRETESAIDIEELISKYAFGEVK